MAAGPVGGLPAGVLPVGVLPVGLMPVAAVLAIINVSRVLPEIVCPLGGGVCDSSLGGVPGVSGTRPGTGAAVKFSPRSASTPATGGAD